MRFCSLISQRAYVQGINNMRIVGGIYKRRLITYPDDASHIRPTKDRVREAIFSALGDLTGYTGLDLYSGSGAMGIEGLSRGCSFMTFVDINKLAIEVTKKNISSLNIKNAEVLFMSDESAINEFIKNKRHFDIIFLDPPYKLGQYEKIISLILENDLLSNRGIIVIESDHDIVIQDNYFVRRDYKYGETKVSILWRK